MERANFTYFKYYRVHLDSQEQLLGVRDVWRVGGQLDALLHQRLDVVVVRECYQLAAVVF